MRRLSIHQIQKIKEAKSVEGLTRFSFGALEKDLHLTEVIRAISKANLEFELVFCGGTSLSKAHEVINRMSEDIDFKVVIPSGLSKTAVRKFLGQTRDALVDALRSCDFRIVDEEIISKADNHYVVIPIEYESVFDSESGLKAFIQLELTGERGIVQKQNVAVKSLLWRDIGFSEDELVVPCSTVNQTVAEKLVSFLRRYSLSLEKGQFDGSLVRHIFDVHALELAGLIAIEEVREIVPLVLEKDVLQFGDQHLAFRDEPAAALLQVLPLIAVDASVGNYWVEFIGGLVDGPAPSFDEAFEAFSRVARSAFS